ncbi:MAG: PH domain-containing protein [Candidatus Nanohaloarchaea archaeon]
MNEDSSFEWLSLDEGEEVLWEGEPLMKSIYPAIAVGIPLTLFFGLGLVIIAAAYLNKKNTDFVVTSEGLYRKTGVISRNVQKIGFNKVQNISFSQGFLGTQFGYGNIEISTAGGSGIEMRFRSIEDPKKVQQLINKHIKKGKEAPTSSDRDTMSEVLAEMKNRRKASVNIPFFLVQYRIYASISGIFC